MRGCCWQTQRSEINAGMILLGWPIQRRLSGKKSARGADLSTFASLLGELGHGPRVGEIRLMET